MVLETILTLILILFSMSAVIWGLYGFIYRFIVSKREHIGYLEVEMSPRYQVLFWVISLPLIILGIILMLI